MLKARLQAYIPPPLLERARRLVYHRGDVTLSSLAEGALQRELERLEQGEAEFQTGRGVLKRGRRVNFTEPGHV